MRLAWNLPPSRPPTLALPRRERRTLIDMARSTSVQVRTYRDHKLELRDDGGTGWTVAIHRRRAASARPETLSQPHAARAQRTAGGGAAPGGPAVGRRAGRDDARPLSAARERPARPTFSPARTLRWAAGLSAPWLGRTRARHQLRHEHEDRARRSDAPRRPRAARRRRLPDLRRPASAVPSRSRRQHGRTEDYLWVVCRGALTRCGAARRLGPPSGGAAIPRIGARQSVHGESA